jgi:SAM-dependent methyltransferase
MDEAGDLSTTRAVYDATADTYVASVGTEINDSFEAPVDQAILLAFAEMVPEGGTVLDAGCGPGRVAALLARRGLDVVGVDLAPGMVTVARRTHPGIRFEEADLTALPLAERSVSAAVYWYSIIHTPADGLGDVFAELQRVIVPGGPVLVAFQAGGGEAVTRADAYGTGMTLTSYRHAPDDLVRALDGAGIQLHARVMRLPMLAHETTPQELVLGTALGL